MNSRLVPWFARAALLCASFAFDAFAEDVVPGNEAIKAAVVKSLPLLETGARGSMEKRKRCFTCHNQALPVMALTTARSRGIAIDADNLRRQVQFTADVLAKNRTCSSLSDLRVRIKSDPLKSDLAHFDFWRG